MNTTLSTTPLAGDELRDHRHVCALVEGPAETDALLVPFIVDGLERGERVVDVLDPGVRDSRIERLGATGIDVVAAMESRQLEVLPWADVYLRGGRFDRSAQLAYLLRMVVETQQLGYRLTRYIGSTEWAVEAQTVKDLLAYEASLENAARRLPDVFVCTYDLSHHSARTIADVLDIHGVAIVGGSLRTRHQMTRESARERLLAAASQLFHEHGIQASGVDAIISAAGVAKATFYRHFPSKDHLVVAWLTDTRTNWLVGVRRVAEERASSPAEVIPLLFEAAAEWFEADGYRGCPYLNASVEITDQAHPALQVVRGFLEFMAAQFGQVAAAAGVRDADVAGRQLKVVMSGAITQALAYHSVSPFETAREAAKRLMGSASRV